jgi:geranylgeranyl diphosphate synthase type I
MSEQAVDRFGAFVAQTRAQVQAWLDPWLDARLREAKARGNANESVAGAARDLVLRGGKRARAALLAAAYEGCGGSDGAITVVAAGASLELFQAYLLTHDDWMDGDDVRRGGPSVPAMLREHFGRAGDALSILAGDLLAAWAQRALLEVPRPAPHLLGACRELARAGEDVVQGQVLDVLGEAGEPAQVELELVHTLKTASYTVRAPVVMGAHLAGASDGQVAALSAFAVPLGIAFQLRDDLLGTFGNPAAMGKPAGSDLRAGKRTALVVHALGDAHAAGAVRDVLGRSDASDSQIGAAVRAIEESGARRSVESAIAMNVEKARDALSRAELLPEGRTLLEGAVGALTVRDR